MKLVLAMMCAGLSVGALAGCSNSTMPAPNDPSTAVHEEPVMASGGPQQTNGTALANAPASHKMLMESTTAAK